MEYERKLEIRLLPPLLSQSDFFKQLKLYVKLNDLQRSYYVAGRQSRTPYEVPKYSKAYLYFKSRAASTDFVMQIKGKSFTDETDESTIPEVGNSLYHMMIDKSEKFNYSINDTTSDLLESNNNEQILDENHDSIENDEFYQIFVKHMKQGIEFLLSKELEAKKLQKRKERTQQIKNKNKDSLINTLQKEKKSQRKKVGGNSKTSNRDEKSNEIDPRNKERRRKPKAPKKLEETNSTKATSTATEQQNTKVLNVKLEKTVSKKLKRPPKKKPVVNAESATSKMSSPTKPAEVKSTSVENATVTRLD